MGAQRTELREREEANGGTEGDALGPTVMGPI